MARIGRWHFTIFRAWFSLDETDSILFEWSATDENIDFASLSNAGRNTSPDVSPFNYEWEINGGLDEGIYNPSLTVQDLDSNVATSTLYIGIDRTGPTVGSPSLTDNNGVITTISQDDWISTNEINVSNLNVGVTDNGGVGADSYEYQIYPMKWMATNLHLVVRQFQLTLENLFYNLGLLIYLEIKEIL